MKIVMVVAVVISLTLMRAIVFILANWWLIWAAFHDRANLPA